MNNLVELLLTAKNRLIIGCEMARFKELLFTLMMVAPGNDLTSDAPEITTEICKGLFERDRFVIYVNFVWLRAVRFTGSFGCFVFSWHVLHATDFFSFTILRIRCKRAR